MLPSSWHFSWGDGMEETQGCPGCGKPTVGSPTEEGFKWAFCADCLSKREAEHRDTLRGSSVDEAHRQREEKEQPG